MKIEFLMCGNMTDAFLSQAAIFRMKLDALGGDYAAARLVMCLGGPERIALPERWVPWFGRIDVIWAEMEHYRAVGDHAQGHLRLAHLDPSADISICCDADTLLLRPFPQNFFDDMRMAPAIAGCIAHYPPPLLKKNGTTQILPSSTADMWSAMADRILGRPIPMPMRYTLQREPQQCPFYINGGFFASTPEVLSKLYDHFKRVLPGVRAVLDNVFYDQLAMTFAVEHGQIPYRALPLRFNFPNDPIAEELHPEEAREIVYLHYLRTDQFDRHRIFSNVSDFDLFMEMELGGVNAFFREDIRRLTGGRYPFGA